MLPPSSSRGLTITNPLVLYRALLATERIDPDPAQHRLALHLQKLYHRLKDYEPEIEYTQRLNQLSRVVGGRTAVSGYGTNSSEGGRNGLFSTFRAQNAKVDALALTRQLTDHESALELQSPQGLLVYGEVGSGKSMLVDLLADCLPNRKKRRWHFNTFMLETFARIEQLRRSRLVDGGPGDEHSLLSLARDMISTSPILFLDEFQLPDRAASKILSNLFTSFFHLGGVLIATSNRMPEELANAQGMEFAPPPASRLGLFGDRWGILARGKDAGRSENMFPNKGDFAAFLEVLRARCEVWDMEGGRDWRRREAEEEDDSFVMGGGKEAETYREGFAGLESMAPGNLGLGYEQSTHDKKSPASVTTKTKSAKGVLPKHYFVSNGSSWIGGEGCPADSEWESAVLKAVSPVEPLFASLDAIPWQSDYIYVFGRKVPITRHYSGVTQWTFDELCASYLGPADYITLASTFHTFILTDVPTLTLLQKNEARRLITLLDALYEARCKLLLRADAGPDDIFFPETNTPPADTKQDPSADSSTDGIYPETFAEIYQDRTAPFRPNISSYTPSASAPTYAPTTQASPTTRSVLADEDSDFGPVYGAGRRTHGPSDGVPGAGNEIGRPAPDFARTGVYTGEDERFAYKRARSRLWEMCGGRWWARGEEEGWWRPVERGVRSWERRPSTAADRTAVAVDVPLTVDGGGGVERGARDVAVDDGWAEKVASGVASPFRTRTDEPPSFSWVHVWGMMRWGKKAGVWGMGVDGLRAKAEGREVEGKEKRGVGGEGGDGKGRGGVDGSR